MDEAYTSQTCPNCGEHHKPKGRVYRCPLVVSFRTEMLSGRPIFALSAYMANQGSHLLAKPSIVTRIFRASVVALAPRMWLGYKTEKPPNFQFARNVTSRDVWVILQKLIWQEHLNIGAP